MSTPANLPKLSELPASLPVDGAISIALEQGVPTFRASEAVVKRITELLEEREVGLGKVDTDELTRYEEIDDYLSHLNRMVRNLQSA